MGIFSKKSKEPVVHPEVDRRIWVAASTDDVADQLRRYSDMQSPKHATAHDLGLTTHDGAVEVTMPPALHPWAFHNLAFWLLDTPGGDGSVTAVSGPSPTHSGYRLVRDPEIADCLCGVDDAGAGWTVLVPTNDIVRDEPVPARSLQVEPAPAGTTTMVQVLLEDPGRAMNPTNEATVASRKRLDRVDVMPIY